MQFQISSRRKERREMPELSRLEFLKKFSATFALSNAADNSGLLITGAIAYLTLVRILLVMQQKIPETYFSQKREVLVFYGRSKR